MSARRMVAAGATGVVLALALLVLLIIGAIVMAVSGERTVHIPLLLTARSGAGADLLGVQMEGLGFVVWFIGLSVLLSLPLALVRRNSPDRKAR